VPDVEARAEEPRGDLHDEREDEDDAGEDRERSHQHAGQVVPAPDRRRQDRLEHRAALAAAARAVRDCL
jgi:hypothetical protein